MGQANTHLLISLSSVVVMEHSSGSCTSHALFKKKKQKQNWQNGTMKNWFQVQKCRYIILFFHGCLRSFIWQKSAGQMLKRLLLKEDQCISFVLSSLILALKLGEIPGGTPGTLQSCAWAIELVPTGGYLQISPDFLLCEKKNLVIVWDPVS